MADTAATLRAGAHPSSRKCLAPSTASGPRCCADAKANFAEHLIDQWSRKYHLEAQCGADGHMRAPQSPVVKCVESTHPVGVRTPHTGKNTTKIQKMLPREKVWSAFQQRNQLLQRSPITESSRAAWTLCSLNCKLQTVWHTVLLYLHCTALLVGLL